MSAAVAAPAPFDFFTAPRVPSLDVRQIAPEDWQYLGDLVPMIELREACRRAPRFTFLPYVEPKRRELTAQPRGSRDAPEWTRYTTALTRFARGAASGQEVTRAIAYERSAVSARGLAPIALRPSPRYRKERQKPPAAPPNFTPAELAVAAEMISHRCAGPLAERAWYELKFPPLSCASVSSLAVRVFRAIWRAERHLRDDACRRKRRGFIQNDEDSEIVHWRKWTFGPDKS